VAQRVSNPREFFKGDVFEEVVNVVRAAFGRDNGRQDTYNHIISPEKVYLLRVDGRVVAMASYSTRDFSGISGLVVDGITVSPKFQGKGVFRELTDLVVNGESVICLRTQNPQMCRALETYCSSLYLGGELPEAISAIRNDFAAYLGSEIDEKGIVKGHYGGLFYGERPTHLKTDKVFEGMGLDVNNGDAVLAVGVR